MGAGQDQPAFLAAPALGDRTVVEAEIAEAGVAAPTVGVDDRARLDVRGDPRPEAALARVGEGREPQPPRAGAADLHRDPHQPLADGVSARLAIGIDAPDEALVDLDLAAQRGALGGDHRPAQLLQDQPGGLIAAEAELALQLLGGDPGRVGRDQIGRPEPEAKRSAGPVHDGPRGDRGLVMAAGALPEVAALQHPGTLGVAGRAAGALGPARGGEVLEAGGLVGESLLDLHDRAREVWPGHKTTLGTPPDGT